jgi:hypothetical protein
MQGLFVKPAWRYEDLQGLGVHGRTALCLMISQAVMNQLRDRFVLFIQNGSTTHATKNKQQRFLRTYTRLASQGLSAAEIKTSAPTYYLAFDIEQQNASEDKHFVFFHLTHSARPPSEPAKSWAWATWPVSTALTRLFFKASNPGMSANFIGHKETQ